MGKNYLKIKIEKLKIFILTVFDFFKRDVSTDD